MGDDVILAGSEIDRSFGDVTVLTDVSLELERGTLTALVGPNGSGKTTLVRILAGLLPPSSGTVRYEGEPADRQIGYLPQQPTFRPGFTARETLEFYTALAGGEPQPLLERVGLGDAGERRVEDLSGGMTRLLGLAQATVGDPPAILLDEPGSGLDPGMRRRTWEVVRDLVDDGTTVLCCSHDLTLVEEYADRVGVLEAGSLVADGSPSDLREAYDRDSLWAAFEAAVDRPTDTVEVMGVTE